MNTRELDAETWQRGGSDACSGAGAGSLIATGVVRDVADVELIASRLAMDQLALVPGLHGRWHLPGVDLTVQQQWPELVVVVAALPDDDPTGRDGWSARMTSAVPCAEVQGLVQRARLAARGGGTGMTGRGAISGWDDTFLPDDGTHPPCRACDDPAARDTDGFVYAHCPDHLLAVSDPDKHQETAGERHEVPGPRLRRGVRAGSPEAPAPIPVAGRVHGR